MWNRTWSAFSISSKEAYSDADFVVIAGVTLFRKELWDMFHDSIHKLPIFHISLRQYKRVIDLYLEARSDSKLWG